MHQSIQVHGLRQFHHQAAHHGILLSWLCPATVSTSSDQLMKFMSHPSNLKLVSLELGVEFGKLSIPFLALFDTKSNPHLSSKQLTWKVNLSARSIYLKLGVYGRKRACEILRSRNDDRKCVHWEELLSIYYGGNCHGGGIWKAEVSCKRYGLSNRFLSHENLGWKKGRSTYGLVEIGGKLDMADSRSHSARNLGTLSSKWKTWMFQTTFVHDFQSEWLFRPIGVLGFSSAKGENSAKAMYAPYTVYTDRAVCITR